MTTPRFTHELERQLPRWVVAGWVTPDHQARILADARGQEKAGWSLPGVIATLGAILLFTGVISFVAANWDDLGRMTKVGLLLAGMASVFGGGLYAERRGTPAIGAALVLLGTLIFGANIMLIAQIYQLEADPPGGVLMWALGALAVALLWPSQLVCGLGFILTALWSGLVVTQHLNFWNGGMWPLPIHGEFLLLWSAFALLALYKDWRQTAHLAGLTLLFWCVETYVAARWSISFGGIVLSAVILAMSAAARFAPRARDYLHVMSRYAWLLLAFWLAVFTMPDIFATVTDFYMFENGFAPVVRIPVALGIGISAFALVGGLSFLLRGFNPLLASAFAVSGMVALGAYLPVIFGQPDTLMARGTYEMVAIVLSILTVAAAVGAVIEGDRRRDRFFINAGLVLFAAKLLMLYFDTFWGLMGRAQFFMVGGLIVIALSIMLERQRRRLLNHIKGASS